MLRAMLMHCICLVSSRRYFQFNQNMISVRVKRISHQVKSSVWKKVFKINDSSIRCDESNISDNNEKNATIPGNYLRIVLNGTVFEWMRIEKKLLLIFHISIF